MRLLVSSRPDSSIVHGRFRDLPQFLAPGDLVVVNTSATLPAAVPCDARGRASGSSCGSRRPRRDQDPERFWIVELRRGDAPFGGVRVDEQLELPGGGTARILAPYAGVRLWLARLDLPLPLEAYLAEHGQPIRYGYVPRRWPLVGVPERLRASSPAAPRCRAPDVRSRRS